MTNYEIVIGANIFNANLIDNGAKIDWSKGDNGLIFNKKLEGKFLLYRSGNETLYDAIKGMTICEEAYLRVVDPIIANEFFAFGIFGIRDIEYNDSKCLMTIKPRYFDPNYIDTIIDKDYNIINSKLARYTLEFDTNYQFEFKTCTAQNVPILAPYFTNNVIDVKADCANNGGFCPDSSCYTGANYLQFGWTFFSQRSVKVGDIIGVNGGYFDIETTWFREVKLVPFAVDPNQTPPPKGDSQFDFEFWGYETINDNIYNKYVRNVDSYAAVRSFEYNYVSSYYGNQATRYVTRARKLIDILEHFKTEFSCTELRSQFFKNNVNPVSGKDLTNLMIMQKSDAKFDEGAERVDPARLGIITFRQLMEQLFAMFQVEWTIVDNILYVEHITFFKNNFNYATNTIIGLDLTAYYPLALEGSHVYKWEQNIPLREKFKFMEAWNIDFIGTDIDYISCIKEGDTETYSAGLITTDIDPTYLDNEASNDGFVIFHCNEANEVVSETGMISNVSSANAHLSWANLHHYYWKSYRWLPFGNMNGKPAVFDHPYRKLKKQNALSFPFCVQNFDDLLYNLVRTTMGDGEIEHAEYSFKEGNIKIELSYGST